MTGVLTYEDAIDNAQSNLWTLLRNDKPLLSLTKNILDGIPIGLTKGEGFPYIIVPTPTLNEEYITFSKKMATLSFDIQVYATKESIVRQIADRIRFICEENKVVFHNSYGQYKFKNSSTGLSYESTQDGDIVYDYTLTITYEWVAW